MTRFSKLFAVTAAAVALTPAAAMAEPARTVEVNAGELKSFQGATATGLNFNYFDLLGNDVVSKPGTCDTSVQYYCDTTLVKYYNPVPDSDADGRLTKRVSVRIADYQPVPDPGTDFDLVASASDETGARGDELAHDGQGTGTGEENVSFSLTTTRANPYAYALIDVVYWTVVQTGYTGEIKG